MISDIRLQHFRSYSDAFFELSDGVTIISGPNASGKTNILEAILVLARGSSYRAKDAELVQFGQTWTRLDATVPTGVRTLKLTTEPTVSKMFHINDQVVSRLHQSRTIPTVLFEPNHLMLLSGSPEVRRSFVDDLIEQSEAGFGTVRRQYKRVLAQRNALLKKNPPGLHQQLFVWNIRLSELGGQIVKRRQALLKRFDERLSELYASLADHNNTITICYASRFSPDHYESQLLHKLELSTELDVLRGFTAYGPHRDDIEVYIDGHLVQEAASRGETRTLVLALKILELQLLEDARGVRPMLLLDDVFSELDIRRRQALTQYVDAYQTFITTPNVDTIASSLSAQATFITLQ